MSLLDLALLAPVQPISVPLSRSPSFLDRYRLSQSFPETQASRMVQTPPTTVDFSQIADRGRFSPVLPDNSAKAGRTEDPSALAALAPKKRESDIDALLRRAGAIIDRYGDPQAVATGEQPSYAPAPPRRRAMTPLEGPDTGEENPNVDNLPRGYFARLARPESGGNYDAVNPYSGAAGPYQFLGSTWGDLMTSNPKLGLTWDGFRNPSKFKEQHEAAIQEFTDRNARALRTKLGRDPTAGELYALHFLGPSGGQQLLDNLDTPTGRFIGEAVFKQNPWLEAYRRRPGRALLGRLDAMMGSDGE